MVENLKIWLASQLGLQEDVVADIQTVRDQLQHNVKALSDFYLNIDANPEFQSMQADMESFTQHCNKLVAMYQEVQ